MIRAVATILLATEAKEISIRRAEVRGPQGGERGWGFWGGGSQLPPYQLGGLRERCKRLPAGSERSPVCQTRFKCSEWPIQAV